MWASQRAASNSTEIKNLLLNALYTVRVSILILSSLWPVLNHKEMLPFVRAMLTVKK